MQPFNELQKLNHNSRIKILVSCQCDTTGVKVEQYHSPVKLFLSWFFFIPCHIMPTSLIPFLCDLLMWILGGF